MLPPLGELPGPGPVAPEGRREGEPALGVVLCRPVEGLAETGPESAQTSDGVHVPWAEKLLFHGGGQTQDILDGWRGGGHVVCLLQAPQG